MQHYFFITHFYLEVGYEKPFGFPIIQYPFESMGSLLCTSIIFLISASQAERDRFYYYFHYLLDNIFIRFGSKLYRQIVGIPMGTNCAPLVADLFLFCYERDFMLSLSDNNQSDVIEAFNSTSRYLDDLILIILILNKW